MFNYAWRLKRAQYKNRCVYILAQEELYPNFLNVANYLLFVLLNFEKA
jgi:hypothetical protein